MADTLKTADERLPADAPPYETSGVATREAMREKGVVHLGYIDGLRGLCALYIVLHHMAGAIGYARGWFDYVVAWGGYCVAVFITISGFCLMLPVTRNGNVLRGGAGLFYRKRIRRILPPYYVALLLSVLVFPVLTKGAVRFTDLLHRPMLRDLWLHAVLLHNWSETTKYTFNGPLWSVAVECQIYVVFPLLVLLWRRLGARWAVACIGVVSVTAAVLLGYHGNVHYLLLFALGMWGAECAGNPSRLRYSGALLPVFTLGLVIGTVRWPLLGDVCVGALTALLLAREATESQSAVRRVLMWPPLRRLGLFSYSIYLVHDVPLLLLGASLGGLALWSPGWRYLFLAVTFVPALLGGAYLFYLAFERPFVSQHAKAATVQEKLSPALM